MKNTLKSLMLLLHYWFPVVMGWSIALVIQRATGLPILPAGIQLYLLGILAAYSVDRLLDPPEAPRPIWLTVCLGVAFVAAAGFGVLTVFQLSPQTIAAIVLFSVISLVYYKAKKIPFLKSIIVSVIWVWAGVTLPFHNETWFGWQFWTTAISLPLVILLIANVILCDFKDLQSDTQQGVRSLPVMLGSRKTLLLISILLICAAAISYQQGRTGLLISSIALIGLAQFPSVLAQDALGPLLADAALALPGFLILFHFI